MGSNPIDFVMEGHHFSTNESTIGALGLVA